MKQPNERGKPLVMGILNVTPDSFSDGGRWNDVKSALDHAVRMVEEGASIIDIGAESTRPGCEPVSSEEEWRRLGPILKEIVPVLDVPVSVDTMKADVAEKSLSCGADIINDVNGFRGEGMFRVCSDYGCEIVISHMYGTYDQMHSVTMGTDYRQEIRGFLDKQISSAVDSGIEDSKIIVDPGIGFGKTSQQNMDILKDCSFLGHEHRVLIGVSRKRVVREFYPDMDIDDASAMLSKMAVESGADIVRVHNVPRTVSELGL